MDKFESIINQIRDILRKEGITGMDSIKHCVLFMFMKFLTSEKCQQLKIDPIYSFEKISELTDANEIKERVFVKSKMCLVNLLKKENIFSVDFKLQSNANLKTIIGKIAGIDIAKLSLKTDIVGIIYELHLKSGTSQAMRDLGQYFTNREVIEWMIKLTNPKIANKKTGEIEKILDPSMGTGGFLTMAIKHLNETNKKIDWVKNKDNIYGFDIDENLYQMSLLNVFIETGLLFDKTICKHDTLHKDYMIDESTLIDKVDVILANEPFGLKNITHAECCERIKELKIRGTKAEPLFLQLMMLSLNPGGRCAVVVPDGVLFNDSNLHTGTREYLVSNLNLKKVTSLNGDFFLNTGVKSSVLYFVNDGTTSQVEFSELVMGESGLKENSICKVGYKDIVTNGYSLFVNKYNTVEEKKLDGIKYMKLGDICEFLPTTKHTSSIGKNEGQYRFYNSSQDDKLYLDSHEINKESIIIGNGGSLCVHHDTKFTASKHVTVTQLKENNSVIKYIYYYLLSNRHLLNEKSAGSTIQWLNKTNLAQIQIPVPSMDKQMEIVETLDLFYEQIERNTQSIKAYERIKKGIVWANTVNCTNMKKLGDVCEFNSQNISKDYQYKTIRYIDIGSLSNNLEFQEFSIGNEPSRAKRIVKLNDILLSTVRPNLENILFIDNKFYCKNLIASTGFITISSKIIYNKFLYYYLQQPNSTEYFVKNSTGSMYPSINIDVVSNYKIPVPSIQVQESIVKECEYYDEQIDRLKKENEKLKAVPVIELCLASESTDSINQTRVENAELEVQDESDENQAESESESKTKVTTFVEPETVKIEIKSKVKKIGPKEFDV